MAALLPLASAGRAQSAADHEALSYGQPIVNGHDVQPTPAVVQERWHHRDLMLRDEAAAAAAAGGDKSSPTGPVANEPLPKADAPTPGGSR